MNSKKPLDETAELLSSGIEREWHMLPNKIMSGTIHGNEFKAEINPPVSL